MIDHVTNRVIYAVFGPLEIVRYTFANILCYSVQFWPTVVNILETIAFCGIKKT